MCDIQIGEAMRCIKKSLMLRPSYAPAQHLLALLLSSQKKYEEALELMRVAVHEFPDSLK
jgi:tetratricopeptide (TPR) repeat protein